MERYSCKQLKSLVASGVAKDVTYAAGRSEIPESYTQIGYAAGIYGCNGMLLKGERTAIRRDRQNICHLHF